MKEPTKKIKALGILLSVCAVIVAVHALMLRRNANTRIDDTAKGYAVIKKTVTEPRLMRITAVIIDIEKLGDRFALAVATNTVLTPPLELSRHGNLDIAMNANPWYNLPARPNEAAPRESIAGNPATLIGWAYGNGRLYSSSKQAHWTFFIVRQDDGTFTPHINPMTIQGDPSRNLVIMVTGFDPVLRNGNILKAPGGTLHPRSAIGFTPDRKHVVMMTVDGRQPGHSLGADEHDLGALMKGLGCSDALNLDGGGSSVLILDGAILNSPSEDRPLPLLFGLRK